MCKVSSLLVLQIEVTSKAGRAAQLYQINYIQKYVQPRILNFLVPFPTEGQTFV